MMGNLLLYISIHLLVSCSVPTIQSAEYEERSAAAVTAADMSQQRVIIGVFISTQHMSAFEDSVRNQSDMRLVSVYTNCTVVIVGIKLLDMQVLCIASSFLSTEDLKFNV